MTKDAALILYVCEFKLRGGSYLFGDFDDKTAHLEDMDYYFVPMCMSESGGYELRTLPYVVFKMYDDYCMMTISTR